MPAQMASQREALTELSNQLGGSSRLWSSVLPLLDRQHPSELRELGAKLIERYNSLVIYGNITAVLFDECGIVLMIMV